MRPSDNGTQFGDGEAGRYRTHRPGTRRALCGCRKRAQAGRRAGVNAQLVSAETGEQFWAERFIVEPDATGDGVDLVVWRIAFLAQRRVFETESARSVRERPDHPDATDALVRAHALSDLPPSPQKQTQLVGLYQRAVELAPSSAPALAGLAEALLDSLPAVSSDDRRRRPSSVAPRNLSAGRNWSIRTRCTSCSPGRSCLGSRTGARN